MVPAENLVGVLLDGILGLHGSLTQPMAHIIQCSRCEEKARGDNGLAARTQSIATTLVVLGVVGVGDVGSHIGHVVHRVEDSSPDLLGILLQDREAAVDLDQTLLA